MWRPISRCFVSKEYRWNSPRMGHRLDELTGQQRLLQEETARLQQQHLASLLDHAYAHVPYYRRRFGELGISPSDIRSAQDFARLPVLTKEDLRTHELELLSEAVPAGDRHVNHSGGSTGAPVRFHQSADYEDRAAAARHLCDHMAGYVPGDRYLILWGADADSRRFTGMRASVRNALRNQRFINTFQLSAQALDECAALMVKWRPEFVRGYASSVGLVARHCAESGIPPPCPKGVVTSAEVLTEDDRNVIGTAMGCGVFNRYGCREVSVIAQECDEHQGMHCLEPFNYVEVVDDEGAPVSAGEMGRVVVTNLHNLAMPLIRYDLRDLGTMAEGACPCGRSWRRLETVVGRRGAVVVLPSGKLLHGEFFTHLFYGRGEVRRFQVVQPTREALEISIVRGEAFRETVSQEIVCAIAEQADPDFQVEIRVVDRLPPLPSGKHEFVRSEVEWRLGQGD